MPHASDENRRLVLNDLAWVTLRRINQEGNALTWTSDSWAGLTRWSFPNQNNGKPFQACDGITLWKMSRLLDAGFPISALYFCVCRDETATGHAVLCITTDAGDFVCDERQRDVLTYDECRALGYAFLYRTSLGHSLRDLWERVQDR